MAAWPKVWMSVRGCLSRGRAGPTSAMCWSNALVLQTPWLTGIFPAEIIGVDVEWWDYLDQPVAAKCIWAHLQWRCPPPPFPRGGVLGMSGNENQTMKKSLFIPFKKKDFLFSSNKYVMTSDDCSAVCAHCCPLVVASRADIKPRLKSSRFHSFEALRKLKILEKTFNSTCKVCVKSETEIWIK